MNLAVFDLDGTLTRTSGVDTSSFTGAFAQEFGIHDINQDWAAYQHTTDSAISDQIFRQRLGRRPSPEELARLQRRMIGLLEAARNENGSYRMTPGADRLLDWIASSQRWKAVIATGSWEASARVKIAASGLPSLPLYTCDGCYTRSEIVRNAIGGSYQRIVLIGDGVWDLRTARELQFPFIGIAPEEQASQLFELGASHVLADFNDLSLSLAALEEAQVP